jgi:hypothetical protein
MFRRQTLLAFRHNLADAPAAAVEQQGLQFAELADGTDRLGCRGDHNRPPPIRSFHSWAAADTTCSEAPRCSMSERLTTSHQRDNRD